MNPKKIAITTGDPDGIGTEVAAKAITELNLDRPIHFYFFRTPHCPKSHLTMVDKKLYRKEVTSVAEALAEQHIDDTVFFDINQTVNPTFFVKQAAELCLQKKIDALVTGPLSKPLIMESGLGVIGHTGLFRQLIPQRPLFMAFVGDHFNVALVTDHIPFQSVPQQLTADRIIACIVECHKLKTKLTHKADKPLALLGLNPHAGDSGLIGQEEKTLLNKIIRQCQTEGIAIEGPLVPDVAFQKSNWEKYSFFVSLYHDQGLIPFKLVHGQESGVHITMGLQFVRTSVDHGTAKDIFNQNKAEPQSMKQALEWAIQAVI